MSGRADSYFSKKSDSNRKNVVAFASRSVPDNFLSPWRAAAVSRGWVPIFYVGLPPGHSSLTDEVLDDLLGCAAVFFFVSVGEPELVADHWAVSYGSSVRRQTERPPRQFVFTYFPESCTDRDRSKAPDWCEFTDFWTAVQSPAQVQETCERAFDSLNSDTWD